MRRTLAHGSTANPWNSREIALARWVLAAAPVIPRPSPTGRYPACAPVLVALAACSALACSSSDAATSGPVAACSTPDAATEGADAAPPDGGIADAGTEDAGPSELRVLFIGNSYTYVNDLPGMLSRIAATSGTPPTITTDEVVQGGATLQVHWENGLAQPKIEKGGWTHVVLQGQSLEALTWGPQSPFFDYAEQFGDLIVDAGARPTLFVTWARAAGDAIYGPFPGGSFVSPDEMQDELNIGYTQVAGLWQESLLACAGEAFRLSNAQYPKIVLQESDRSHPTVAGTYLAASTFYVALTGKPVPDQSEVPAGLDAADAASLREVAKVGSKCTNSQLNGGILADVPTVSQGGPPLDFGTTTLPAASQISLTNVGGLVVGIRDGMSLAPPFEWTGGGAYPGGSGAGFCGSSLEPGVSCVLSVTYTGKTSATGNLTLDFTDSYTPSATWALEGSTTNRALLLVSDAPGTGGCTDTCGPAGVSAASGATASLDLFVTNVGALPVAAIGAGTPLASPFAWGGGAFPGGVGSVIYGGSGTSYPYCSAATLGTGQACVVTVTFSPPATGTYPAKVSLTYSDALGPVAPNANRNVQGQCSDLPP